MDVGSWQLGQEKRGCAFVHREWHRTMRRVDMLNPKAQQARIESAEALKVLFTLRAMSTAQSPVDPPARLHPRQAPAAGGLTAIAVAQPHLRPRVEVGVDGRVVGQDACK